MSTASHILKHEAEFQTTQRMYEAAGKTIDHMSTLPGHLRVTYSTYSELPDEMKDYMLATMYQRMDRNEWCFNSMVRESHAIMEWVFDHVRQWDDGVLLKEFVQWYDEYQINTCGMDNGPTHYVPEDLEELYARDLEAEEVQAARDEAMKIDVFSHTFGAILRNEERGLITQEESRNSLVTLCNDMLVHMMGKVA